MQQQIQAQEIQRQVGAAKLEIMESVPKQIYQHVKAEVEEARAGLAAVMRVPSPAEAKKTAEDRLLGLMVSGGLKVDCICSNTF